MTTPDYYKYDDGETHFECFDISRYYSGDNRDHDSGHSPRAIEFV